MILTKKISSQPSVRLLVAMVEYVFHTILAHARRVGAGQHVCRHNVHIHALMEDVLLQTCVHVTMAGMGSGVIKVCEL